MNDAKFIDVEKIIGDKNPKALRWLPGFVVRYLKRIIHQKEINEFLDRNRDVENVEFCHEVMKFLSISYDVRHKERIPVDGNIVLVMNHPLGGMDAIILISALDGHRNDLKFIVNDILMNLENLNDLFVGVSKTGTKKKDSILEVQKLFESENAVCIFPAGLVSRKIDSEIQDLPWRRTFITSSRKNDRQVIPIYIEGRLSNFFYRLSKIRKFFRIKTNIEMLYLSNELFKQKNAKVTFVVGEPIEDGIMRSDKSDKEISAIVRDKLYELRKEI